MHRGTGLTVGMIIAIEPLAKAGRYRPRPSQESKNNTTFIDIYNAFNTGVDKKKKQKREREREWESGREREQGTVLYQKYSLLFGISAAVQIFNIVFALFSF